MTDWIDRPLCDQASALRDGDTTSVALVSATLERVHARRALDAVTWIAADALDQAQAADAALHAGVDLGPLHGLPIALKDMFAAQGQPNLCGSKAMPTTLLREDSAPVAALRRAGALPILRVATYEFALTGPAWDQPYPPARNPWHRDHITGGSSSGSAAAVAGGLVRAALGTDTGGSVRSPAAYCGIVGLKPTRGRIRDDGVFPLSQTLDTIGPLAASVREAALVLDVLSCAGTPAASRELGHDPKGLRLGFARDWLQDAAAHPALLALLDDAVGLLSRLDMEISLVDMPDYAQAEDAGCVLIQAEAWQVHGARLAKRGQDYGRDARLNLISGAVLTARDVEKAQAHAQLLSADIDAALAGRDAIVTATTLTPAPAFAQFADGAVWTPMRTFPFNISGHPAITVPCGLIDGLPVGLQIIGAKGGEARICRIAQAFEQASDHCLQKPPL
ncbi:Glutamyl-tRNA(Gln) amidotransferase subunit A [Aquimixticola soesokkakensis]|uniref:Glutamyl-tRNA(Gln) amidotransferase subunit A n=1 Tax=Aquimixticola soesokkakensis TaxID=1519096 RepID=A0A1Y5THN8_9RHOB|nr:amidase [Aquimixticola soesokkakensis]SLN63877.1 Glutamyl-tRNA(Gln) amidotransferase subunit A [Aquimixticola soesokkakensis]